MNSIEKIEWIIAKHSGTNHYYDKYLPYEFHLRMVVQTCKDFSKLLPNQWSEVEIACWGHDLIEDTRTNYNECKENLGVFVANIIYAVTNEKGKNRAERGNDRYYEGIRQNDYAVFVKLCDRIANVQYSKLTGSKMFETYRHENDSFTAKLRLNKYSEMVDYLNSLFI